MLDQHAAPTPAADDDPQSAPKVQSAVAETNAPETVPSHDMLLKQAELAAQEHHDAWLRAKADADNIRKRAQADIANAHKYAIENFSTELLAVKDSLEAALSAGSAGIKKSIALVPALNRRNKSGSVCPRIMHANAFCHWSPQSGVALLGANHFISASV